VVDAQRIKLALHERSRRVLVEAKLGLTVYGTAQLDDVRGQGVVYFDRHCRRS
jgi:hypothetical protein